MAISNGIASKLKALFGVHDGTASGEFDVEDHVDRMFEYSIPVVKAQNTTDVDQVVYSPRTDCKLVAARFVAAQAIAANDTNFVTFTITTNGTECANVNTKAASLNGITINTAANMSVNTAASQCNANTVCKIAITHSGGANAPNTYGTMVLHFRQE